MAKILVYNNDNNRMETYYRGENEAMPYNSRQNLNRWRIQADLAKAQHYGLVNVLCSLGTAKDIFLVSLFQQDLHLKDLGKVVMVFNHSTMQEQHLMYARLVLLLKELVLEIVRKIREFGHMQSLHHLHLHGYILTNVLLDLHVQAGGFPQVKRGSVRNVYINCTR